MRILWIILTLCVVGCSQPPAELTPTPTATAPKVSGAELLSRGLIAVDSGNVGEAADYALKLEKAEPDGRRATILRLQMAVLTRDDKAIVAHSRQLETSFPTDPEAVSARALVLAQVGGIDDALSLLDEQRQTDIIVCQKGFLLQHFKHDARGAIKQFDKALELNAGNARAYTYRGLARVDEGDLEGAKVDLDEAVALDPRSPTAFFVRATVDLDLEKRVEALADINECLKLAPEDALALEVRSDLLAENGDKVGARTDLEKIVRLNRDPESVKNAKQKLKGLK